MNMFAKRKPFSALALLALTGAISLSCGGDGTGPGPTIAVTPGSVSISIGETQQLTVTVRDGNSNAITSGFTLSYASASAAIAAVDQSGLVTGMSEGTTTIEITGQLNVTGQNLRSTVSVTVVGGAVASVEVVATATLSVGNTAQLTATLKNANGAVLTGRTITWASADASIVTVGTDGTITGIAAGTANVTATSEGQTGTTSVTVNNVAVASVQLDTDSTGINIGATITLTATTRDAGGNVLTGRPISWTSRQPATATVDAAGVVTGVAVGTAIIVATSEGQSDSATVTVTQVPVVTVDVTPGAVAMVPGDTATLTATPRDAAGNALVGRTIVWTSANATIATVNGSGLVTAVGAGTVNITALVDGINNFSVITVTAAPAVTDSVEITPTSPVVQPGDSVQLTATARDAAGNVLGGKTVTWTSLAPATATVSNTGLVTGVADGSAGIVATIESVADTATVLVLTPGSQICEAIGGASCFYMDSSAAGGTCTFADPCTPSTLNSIVTPAAGDYAYFMAGPSSALTTRTYIGPAGAPVFGRNLGADPPLCNAGVRYKAYPGDSIIFNGQRTAPGQANHHYVVRLLCDNMTFEYVTIRNGFSALQIEAADFVTVRHVVCDSMFADTGGGNDGCMRTENAFNSTFEYNTLIDFFDVNGSSQNINGLQETGNLQQGNHVFRYNLFMPRQDFRQTGILQKKPNLAGTFEVYGNVFMGKGGLAVSITGTEAQIHHNLIIGEWWGVDWGRDPAKPDSATVIQYNTFSTDRGRWVHDLNHGFNFDNQFTRNIGVSSAASWQDGMQPITHGRFQDQASFDMYSASYIIDENCYYVPNSQFEVQWWPFGPGLTPIVGGVNGNFADWQAAGKDVNSFETNVMFGNDTQTLDGDYSIGAAQCSSFGVYGDSTLAQFPAPGTIRTKIGAQRDPLAP